MQRGFAPIIVLIILLVGGLLASGGYYFYQQQKIQNLNSQITDYESCIRLQSNKAQLAIYPGQCTSPDGRTFTQQISEEEKKKLAPPQASSSEIPKVVSTLMVYKDMDYDYLLKYPSDWSFISANTRSKYNLDYTNSGGVHEDQYTLDKYELQKVTFQKNIDVRRFNPDGSFDITVISKPGITSLEQWNDNFNPKMATGAEIVYKREDVEINGYKGKKLILASVDYDDTLTVFYENNDLYYLRYSNVDLEDKEIFEQMLNSFKLLK